MTYLPHKQVPCKVNAHVDEGIKELVELFNSFENTETIESCQGYPNKTIGTENRAIIIMRCYSREAELSGLYSDKTLEVTARLEKFAERIHWSIHKHDFPNGGALDISNPPSLMLNTNIEIVWGCGFTLDDRPLSGELVVWLSNEDIGEFTKVIRKLRDEISSL